MIVLIYYQAAQGDSEALVVETNSDNSIILELYALLSPLLLPLFPSPLPTSPSLCYSLSLSPLLAPFPIYYPHLYCRPNSRVFVVPPQNVNLPNPPKKGEVVTYTYDVASRRPIPMSPKVVRVREDVAWDEVVAQHQREVQARSLNGTSSTSYSRSSPLCPLSPLSSPLPLPCPLSSFPSHLISLLSSFRILQRCSELQKRVPWVLDGGQGEKHESVLGRVCQEDEFRPPPSFYLVPPFSRRHQEGKGMARDRGEGRGRRWREGSDKRERKKSKKWCDVLAPLCSFPSL